MFKTHLLWLWDLQSDISTHTCIVSDSEVCYDILHLLDYSCTRVSSVLRIWSSARWNPSFWQYHEWPTSSIFVPLSLWDELFSTFRNLNIILSGTLPFPSRWCQKYQAAPSSCYGNEDELILSSSSFHLLIHSYFPIQVIPSLGSALDHTLVWHHCCGWFAIGGCFLNCWLRVRIPSQGYTLI